MYNDSSNLPSSTPKKRESHTAHNSGTANFFTDIFAEMDEMQSDYRRWSDSLDSPDIASTIKTDLSDDNTLDPVVHNVHEEAHTSSMAISLPAAATGTEPSTSWLPALVNHLQTRSTTEDITLKSLSTMIPQTPPLVIKKKLDPIKNIPLSPLTRPIVESVTSPAKPAQEVLASTLSPEHSKPTQVVTHQAERGSSRLPLFSLPHKLMPMKAPASAPPMAPPKPAKKETASGTPSRLPIFSSTRTRLATISGKIAGRRLSRVVS